MEGYWPFALYVQAYGKIFMSLIKVLGAKGFRDTWHHLFWIFGIRFESWEIREYNVWVKKYIMLELKTFRIYWELL